MRDSVKQQQRLHPTLLPVTVCPMPAGPQLDLPHDVTPKQLETLLNGLLKQEEKLPYSFFVNEQQLSQELGAHLLLNKVRLHHHLSVIALVYTFVRIVAQSNAQSFSAGEA